MHKQTNKQTHTHAYAWHTIRTNHTSASASRLTVLKAPPASICLRSGTDGRFLLSIGENIAPFARVAPAPTGRAASWCGVVWCVIIVITWPALCAAAADQHAHNRAARTLGAERGRVDCFFLGTAAGASKSASKSSKPTSTTLSCLRLTPALEEEPIEPDALALATCAWR